MSRHLLLLLAAVCALGAADPYDAWAQGRPAEAVVPLVATAAASDHWDAWLDAGLAAAAAGQRGEALACLARAHQRAPARSEPRDGMRALGAALPTTWCERAGPLALPGLGWTGVVLLACAGLALGGGWGLRRGRGLVLTLGLLALFAALPGALAQVLDRRDDWVATVRDTQALDSTGAPQQALPAGSLLRLDDGRTWGQRSLVILPDGGSAWVASRDLDPRG